MEKAFLEKNKISRRTMGIEMGLLSAWAIILTVRNIQTIVGTYVTTMYAFTYDHGFLPRGVMGSLLMLIDKVLPGTQYDYDGVRAMCYASDFLFVAVLLCFFAFCLRRCSTELNGAVFAMTFVLGTFAFPEYICFQNFGRTDAACAVLMILMAYLLIRDRAVWLCIPLSALGVMIHQGFVLQFIGLPLALLFYRMMEAFCSGQADGRIDWKNKKGRYDFLVAALTVLAAGALFLYLNFCHSGSRAVYDEVLSVAGSLSYEGYDGEVHKQLIMHEILGEDPASDEAALHAQNFREGIVYAVLMSPYLVLGISFFAGCIGRAKGIANKSKYIVAALGAWLILPDLIVKIDYGRWVFCMILYYFLVVMALLVMRDAIAIGSFRQVAGKVAARRWRIALLALYPLLFTPMGDTWITQTSLKLTKMLMGLF